MRQERDRRKQTTCARQRIGLQAQLPWTISTHTFRLENELTAAAWHHALRFGTGQVTPRRDNIVRVESA